eukprot:gene1538-12664_t
MEGFDDFGDDFGSVVEGVDEESDLNSKSISQTLTTPTELKKEEKPEKKKTNSANRFSLKKFLSSPENKREPITHLDFPKYLKKYTLNYMLDNENLREHLRISSEKTYCAENILFFEEILEYKKLKSPEDRKILAKRIYETYLAPDSQKEVNLNQQQRNTVLNELEKPTRVLFKICEDEIKFLIKTENYHRFIHSREDFGRMLEDNERVTYVTAPTPRKNSLASKFTKSLTNIMKL